MLTARRTRWWSVRYELAQDGVVEATWTWSRMGRSGALTVGGRTIAASASSWTGRRFRFVGPDGRVVAEGDRVGSAGWDLHTPDGEHRFERRSYLRRDQSLVVDGVETGSVSRISAFSSDVAADLPTLPAATRLCVVAALLTVWDQDDASA